MLGDAAAGAGRACRGPSPEELRAATGPATAAGAVLITVGRSAVQERHCEVAFDRMRCATAFS